MNRIAKVWEELDKKNGRHANLKKDSKRQNVKLAKVSDFEEFENEEDRINDDVNRLGDALDDLENTLMTVLSDAETILSLNEDYIQNVNSTYDELADQFNELGINIEQHPVGKLHEERTMSYDYVNEEVNKVMYKSLEGFENQIRAIIGSKK